jgi:hypothetical protein
VAGGLSVPSGVLAPSGVLERSDLGLGAFGGASNAGLVSLAALPCEDLGPIN